MAKSFPNTGATVIDATADLPGSPSEGMMVFQKDTNELKIYDGSAWVSMLDTDTPPGMVLLAPTSVSGTNVSLSGFKTVSTGTTALTINGVFSSLYTSYYVMCSRFTLTSSSAQPYRMQLTSAGTPAATNYNSVGYYLQATSNPTGRNFTGDTTNWQIQANQAGTTAGSVSNMINIQLGSPFLAEKSAMSLSSALAFTPNNQTEWIVGNHTTASSYDGIKIYSAGTFTGNVVVYGYRES